MRETEFKPAKLFMGTIFKDEKILRKTLNKLQEKFGDIETISQKFEFTQTDYYIKEMGSPLYRRFYVYKNLINPELLADIKRYTNIMEEDIMKEQKSSGRIINLDPGIVLAGSMIVATAKNFSHRIPLKNGIYAHLEYMFTKKNVQELPWTYLDFRSKEYKEFFFTVRKNYLLELKSKGYK